MDSNGDTKLAVDSGNESSGYDVDFALDVENRSTRERQTELEEYPYEVLSTEEIVQQMGDCIKEVMQVIEIPATTTRVLLNHFKWDKEKFVERFYDVDVGDQDQLFAEARVINAFRKLVLQKPKLPRLISNTGTEECEICVSVLPTSSASLMMGLECGHRFCTQCWSEYLTIKIMGEGLGQTIACAAHACDILVDDATVMRLVRDPRVKLKYQHIITNSFVECNQLLRWCPFPDCSNAIKVAYVEAAPVTCRCTHTFCFACGENWHDPVRCCLLRKWIKKYDDDSETCNWIAAYTKACPKCNVPIEKNGGCNFIVCGNQNCEAYFCWDCLGLWELHGSVSCDRYKEMAGRDGQERSRAAAAALQRYERFLFYCNRYMNHMKSLRLESKLYASVKEKEETQQHYLGWIEVEIVKKAMDILCQCRQTLMYTYVFAYYLRKNNQSVIFEDNQRDLESATETLSWHLQRVIIGEDLTHNMQKVLDKYIYCDNRRKVLLEHVHEGYEKDCWDYTE